MSAAETPAQMSRPACDRPVGAGVIAVVLVGFPLAYWVKDAVFPWAGDLFGDDNHDAFYGFWLSVVALHWATALTAMLVARGNASLWQSSGCPTGQPPCGGHSSSERSALASSRSAR